MYSGGKSDILKPGKTLNKALPRQGERRKSMEFQHVKPKALMLIWEKISVSQKKDR